MKQKIDLKAFVALPKKLKPSDYIDILLLLIKEKPSLRLGYNQPDVYEQMKQWCVTYSFSFVIGKEGFMYISRNSILVKMTSLVDNLTVKHEYLLGRLLGYPICCAKKVSKIGESNIDEYERKLLLTSSFEPPYHITSPNGYTKGYSLVSHVPCCDKCKKSLQIASRVYDIIDKNVDEPAYAVWKQHWKKINVKKEIEIEI